MSVPFLRRSESMKLAISPQADGLGNRSCFAGQGLPIDGENSPNIQLRLASC